MFVFVQDWCEEYLFVLVIDLVVFGFFEIDIVGLNQFVMDFDLIVMMIVCGGEVVVFYGEIDCLIMVYLLCKLLMSGLMGIVVDVGVVCFDQMLEEFGVDDLIGLSEQECLVMVCDIIIFMLGVYILFVVEILQMCES